MVSSWTVALLYQQLERYTDLLRSAGRSEHAAKVASLAGRVLNDLQHYLIEDDIIAGYALFYPDGTRELIMHPNDRRTGVQYSLIPMTRGILAGVFSTQQVGKHIRLIQDHLLFPDGVRLMDRPVAYHGGLERIFRRAESAANFGREIALMYTHAHLRYCDAMGTQAEWQAMREGLAAANPILLSQRLPNAALRQLNTYYTSSDAAFADRYEASAEWDRIRAGTIPLEGGWRIYSSGPGIYVRLLMRYLRRLGKAEA
jgi:cellobiose phosphorylase